MRLHFYVILIVFKKVTLDIDGEDGNDFSPTNKVSFLQNERSECSGRLKFERVFKKL